MCVRSEVGLVLRRENVTDPAMVVSLSPGVLWRWRIQLSINTQID